MTPRRRTGEPGFRDAHGLDRSCPFSTSSPGRASAGRLARHSGNRARAARRLSRFPRRCSERHALAIVIVLGLAGGVLARCPRDGARPARDGGADRPVDRHVLVGLMLILVCRSSSAVPPSGAGSRAARAAAVTLADTTWVTRASRARHAESSAGLHQPPARAKGTRERSPSAPRAAQCPHSDHHRAGDAIGELGGAVVTRRIRMPAWGRSCSTPAPGATIRVRRTSVLIGLRVRGRQNRRRPALRLLDPRVRVCMRPSARAGEPLLKGSPCFFRNPLALSGLGISGSPARRPLARRWAPTLAQPERDGAPEAAASTGGRAVTCRHRSAGRT